MAKQVKIKYFIISLFIFSDDAHAADDEYNTKISCYYGIAHGIREEVTDQPEMLVNGTLKEYQVGISLFDL